MTERREPGPLTGSEPLTDQQKAQLGKTFTECIRNGAIFHRHMNLDRDFWVYTYENPADLLDPAGYIPQYMFITPSGEPDGARNFRLNVKKKGFHTKLPKTEVYALSLIKNTELVKDVRKANLRLDHVEAVQEVSGISDEALAVASIRVAIGLGTTAPQRAYVEVLELELEQQWSAAGECSSAEANHLNDLLLQSAPSEANLMDVMVGNY